jgi:acetyl esterase
MRVYRPVVGEILPALVYFHGGGWTIGDLDSHDVLCRQLALGARCAVFSVDYRLAPEHPFPAAVQDCLAATRYVAENAARLNVRGIALGGDSAGGNLAAVVALLAGDAGAPQLAFQLLIYPATDQRCATPSQERNAQGYLLTRDAIRYFRRHYLPEERDWLDWRASPLLATNHANLPPALIITAGYDPLRDEGSAYADKLRAAGVKVAYREYADMVHGFVLFGGVLDSANAALVECAAALRSAFERVPA